jgi:hypothetical protein
MFESAAYDKYLLRTWMKSQRQIEGASLIAAINDPGDARPGSKLSRWGRLDGNENNGDVREEFLSVLEQERQRMVRDRKYDVDIIVGILRPQIIA